jgi:hypothetical protein
MSKLRTMLCVFSAALLTAVVARGDQVLVDFGNNFDVATLKSHDVKLSPSGGVLRITTGREALESGIVVNAPDGGWDLSSYADVAMDVKNVGQNSVRVFCRIENPPAGGATHYMAHSIEVPPGATQTLRVALPRRFSREFREKLAGMRLPPAQISIQPFDLAKVSRLAVFVVKSKEEHSFEIGNISACGTAQKALAAQEASFFPFIDTFGQYMHKDWPRKTQSIDDLVARKQEEAIDLAAHPGPEDWNQYGGWKSGPKLKATGFFRTEKHEGKWWLVDPEGRLFWSQGITCVIAGHDTTATANREHWFAGLPKPRPAVVAFSVVNLSLKYGANWDNDYRAILQQRLRSWGINTIANWSDSRLGLMHQTPYTATISTYSCRRLEGSEGFWGKFPDPFDAKLPALLQGQMRNRQFRDPWCIGFFVDNELGWGGDGVSLALATLRSPHDQPAKRVFLEDLRKKYETIENLNAAWGTQNASWDALQQSTTPPDKRQARADLEAFYMRLAEQYFAVCRAAIKQGAPQQLYLGCRFATLWRNEQAVRAAAKYCDVVSFNIYKRASDLRLPKGADKPIMIGEFHFGALDRGLFHPGLVATPSQEARAQAYKEYVEGALVNPAIVGAHWFEYMDEATTGRGDGENFQIGFVDVCDTPNLEIVAAARQLGAELYPLRAR